MMGTFQNSLPALPVPQTAFQNSWQHTAAVLLESNDVIDFVVTSCCGYCSQRGEADDVNYVTYSRYLQLAKMEELKLIDAESNKEYKITVSKEDAARAKRDHIFVYSLLQQAKKYASGEIEDIFIEDSIIETDDANDCSTASNLDYTSGTSDTKDQHIWTCAETLLLITLYKEHEEMFNNPKMSAKQCWNNISKKMEDAGYQISGIKCTTKFQCLKRTYKSVTDHNKKSGNNRRKWEYLEVMHEIFGTKPWVEPIATAGSSVNISANTNNDTTNDTENNDAIKSVPKKRKVQDIIEDYIETSLKMKTEKEVNAKKRHEEKMNRLTSIENLITEMVKK